MDRLFLNIKFYKFGNPTNDTPNVPQVEIHKVSKWNGAGQDGEYDSKRMFVGSYKEAYPHSCPLFGSLLNRANFMSDNCSTRYDYYSYKTVIVAGKSKKESLQKITEAVKIAFGEVQKYIKKEHEEEEKAMNSYESFLDTGGYSLKSYPNKN